MQKRKSKYRKISKREIKEIMQRQEDFKKYYKEKCGDEGNNIYNIVIIMRWLEEHEGFDFSKKGEAGIPPKYRNINPDEPKFVIIKGEVVYL